MLDAIKKFFISLFEKFLQATKESDIKPPLPRKPPVQPDYEVKLWCPFAEYSQTQIQKGKYESGYPMGAVIHATAGRDKTEQDAIDTILWGKDKGYCFFMIGPTGKIYQTIPLDSWGPHCGQSSWPGLGEGLSNKLVGIEIACAGKLERYSDNIFKSWFGEKYKDLDNTPMDEVRFVNANYGCPMGHYKVYTKAQEDSLLKLLYWLKANNPKVFNLDYVLGHHEVSPDRKSDPGGSLSMSMKELRKRLKDVT